MELLRSLFPRKKESPSQTRDFLPNTDVEGLDNEALLVCIRQVLALLRRRRCAANHLGLDNPFHERGLDWQTRAWYLDNGSSEEELVASLQSDLIALLENPGRVSAALRERIIFTSYFSGQLEDYYEYGVDVEPLIFSSEGSPINFRNTLFDKISFPRRMELIASFDPEPKGHRHQIRYFRVLLFAYSLAHMLQASADPATQAAAKLLLQDEAEFARGLVTVKSCADTTGINFGNLPLDENLLYSKDKVSESVDLFERYVHYAQELFD
ncbi:MAG: hypothetical protein GW947_00115 [Candidatus Pacebacteria bacterium]|nr:hypothetical protein [Candidatus Paceibacterota bacterium]